MKTNHVKKLFSVMLVFVLCVALTACSKDKDPETTPTSTPTPTEAANKEEVTSTPAPENPASGDTPLVVGYLPFSEKFSPFFADTGYDQDVVDFVSIGLMTTDRTGAIIYNAIEGETHPYNGTDYMYTGISNIKVDYDKDADITTYNVKLKEGVKFSDGEVLDADDVIFSYYVLADTNFDGSSSLRASEIIGMKNYRYNNSNAENTEVKAEEIQAELSNPSDATKEYITTFNSDLLKSELEAVKGLYGQEAYKSYTDAYPVAKDLFAYLYSNDEAYDSTKIESEEQVLADIIAMYGSDYAALEVAFGSPLTPQIEGWVNEQLLNKKLTEAGGSEVLNIEGIKKLGQYEIEVKTRGFEAPAVYQICGITIAPMHYYGDAAQYDYDNNKFGFPKGDLTIVRSKTTKPLGAGPYKFVKYENKVVYLEANENYYDGAPLTKYLQLKETADKDKAPGVSTGTIDIADPAGSVAVFDQIKGYNSNGELSGDKVVTSTVDNLGYGYIGINADTVKVGSNSGSAESKNLRKAISTILSVYRDVTIDSYYGDVASVINYPISNTSWAAPQKSDEGYEIAFSKDVDGNPIYTADMSADDKYTAANKAAIGFLKAAGYTFDEAAGKFTAAPEGAKMEYEIMISGGGTGDHPSFSILTSAKESLGKIGITLTINDLSESNSNVMWDRMDAGTQELFVAAWGATIDPDMYQVYHSNNIVGKNGTDSNHYHIADAELDKAIIDARKSSDQTFRKATYKSVLDIILDWGVEIPVYQRQNCIIFSNDRVDVSTLTPDITTYWNWFAEINKLKMK